MCTLPEGLSGSAVGRQDILEEPAPRMFWPKEIWGTYAGDLAAFKVLLLRQFRKQICSRLP